MEVVNSILFALDISICVINQRLLQHIFGKPVVNHLYLHFVDHLKNLAGD